MKSRFILMASLGLLAAGCPRSEDQNSSSSEAQQAPPPAPTGPTIAVSAAAPSSDVVSYPEQVTQSGTVKLAQQVKVHQAADTTSTMLTRLGPGTVVEKKASYGEWLLVNWPSGVGETSPGWVQSSYLVVPVITDGGVPLPSDGGVFPPDAGQLTDAGRTSIIPPPVRGGPTGSPVTPTPTGTPTGKRPTFKLGPQ
jgi:hypothetical protein